MRNIVYYVACSLDGFISGPENDVSNFIYEGDGVEKFLSDLNQFDAVLMGRTTYEFGYNYGMIPGQPSPTYAHMMHYIFSNHLEIENLHPQVQIKKMDIDEIVRLKNSVGKDIYLCGGGKFAGWLLDNHKIDIVKIKLNPILLGSGTRLFGDSISFNQFQLLNAETFEHGLQILTYKVIY